MPGEIRRAERIVEEFERQEAARPFSEQSDEELVRAFDEGLPSAAEVAVIHVSGSGLTSSSFEWLRRLTKQWLRDVTGALHNTLCSGLPGLESAQPAYELWDLSRIVLASQALREAFAPRDAHEIQRQVDRLSEESLSTFRRQLDQFLTRHGHRSVMEAESAAKSWAEDLPTVYAMVRNYLRADPTSDPKRIEDRQRRAREEATRHALRRLSWWRRLIFRYVLGQAQEWVVAREHTKSLLVRGSHRGRRLTRELARRMVARGQLTDLWDFYYLTWEEVKSLLRGGLSKDDADTQIARRRAEQARNRQVVLPEHFKGRPKPLRPEDVPLPGGHVLRGIPVSPGRVTGPARVIVDPREDAAIEPGEILVAPVTDAGWTPLFVAASGIVVDIGGSLSHGSTVAREYGLPAVVNVKHGTRMIRTGQTITVDGAQGIVILEEESPDG
jgi:pyruvate,water dikinase